MKNYLTNPEEEKVNSFNNAKYEALKRAAGMGEVDMHTVKKTVSPQKKKDRRVSNVKSDITSITEQVRISKDSYFKIRNHLNDLYRKDGKRCSIRCFLDELIVSFFKNEN